MVQPNEGRKIRKVHYNFFTNKEGKHFEVYEIGKNGVKLIFQHMPSGPGDVMFYDVEFEDSSMVRVFNPNQIFYTKMMKEVILPENKLVGLH